MVIFRIINICLLMFVLVIANKSNAQEDLLFKYGDYVFKTKYDTAEFQSKLTVTYDSKRIFKEDYPGWITSIKDYDMNGDGNKLIFIETYSGGAHCCVELMAGIADDGKFKFTDTLFLGNGSYEISDLDKDGRLELLKYDDLFAYAFTNYAETRFPPVVYRMKNNKFKIVTKEFPKIVNDAISGLKKDLREITERSFECLGENDDTFNTDAGTVKLILAAITYCYYSIGEANKGYDLINKTYGCPDKDKYIKILKEDYKIK